VQKAGVIPFKSLIKYPITFLCFLNKLSNLTISSGLNSSLTMTRYVLSAPKNSYMNPLGSGFNSMSGGETWTDPQGGYPSGCRLSSGGIRT
jgi:hypothetical protein